jgi:hypothetical protein
MNVFTHPPDDRTADERDRAADSREARLDQRERAVAARESAQLDDADRQLILDAADERDRQADERDHEADVRDRVASLSDFLGDADFGPGHKARRMAGADRMDSKDDRTSAAVDRVSLSRRPDRTVCY